MRCKPAFFAFFLLLDALSAQNPNQAPVISNFGALADWDNNILTVKYDVADAENDPLEVSVALSGDGGKTYALTGLLPPPAGDAGFPVMPGSGRSIVFNISALAAMQNSFTVRLVADDKQPFDLQQLVNEVDSNRLRAGLQFVEGIRHRSTGTAHLEAVRDSLRHHFSALGLYSGEHTFTYSGATGRNILGVQTGTAAAEKVVIVDAHYDTVQDAPGADDNGSGVVGFMEISRLLSRYPAKKSLRYIGFDMEEDGLRGSIAYLANGFSAGEQVEGVFNFEMIGYYSEQPNSQQIPNGFELFFPDAVAQIGSNQNRGDFITNVANSNSQALALLFSSSAAQYVPDLKVVTLVAPGNGSLFADLLRSDHAPFWFTNKPALMLTDGANYRNECYHTPQDTAEGKLNFTFMRNVVKATLAAAAQLAEIQHGDWAEATFQNTVGTPERPSCQFNARYDNTSGVIDLTLADCPFSEARVEILDEKGAVVYAESLNLNENEQHYAVWVPRLAAGMYFAKMSWPGGIRTQKFVRM